MGGKYVLISPDGVEYQHAFQMEQALGIDRNILISRCKQNHYGYSRRPKTNEELAEAYSNIEICCPLSIPLTKDKRPYPKVGSKFIFVGSDGFESDDIKIFADRYGISVAMARSRCARNNMGFSRKHK